MGAEPRVVDGEGVAAIGDGVRIAWMIRGAARGGVPILLLRALGGSMALWGELLERLAGARPVIAFDPRGVGRSSDAPLGITTRALARDACALLDVLGVRRVHAVGESMGGMVASWIAIDAPTRVDRLVLVSTLPEASAVSIRAIARAAGFARCFARRGGDAEVCLVHRVISRDFQRAHPERMAQLDAIVRATPARRANLIALALAAARHRAGHSLRRIHAPALLVFGADDPIAGRHSRDELVRDCPDADLELLEGAGHALSIERPRELAARLLAFL
jgi:3-oxoadipate enol-lactonase